MAAAARVAQFDDDVRWLVNADRYFLGGTRYPEATADAFLRYSNALRPHLPLHLATSGTVAKRVNMTVLTEEVEELRNRRLREPPEASGADWRHPRGMDPRGDTSLRNPALANPLHLAAVPSASHVDRVPTDRHFFQDPWFTFCDVVAPIEHWPFFIRKILQVQVHFGNHERMVAVNFAVLNGVAWQTLDKALSARLGSEYFQRNRQHQCFSRYASFFTANGNWNVARRASSYSYSVRHRQMRTLMDEPCDKRGRVLHERRDE